jgi:hypothetical protein
MHSGGGEVDRITINNPGGSALAAGACSVAQRKGHIVDHLTERLRCGTQGHSSNGRRP